MKCMRILAVVSIFSLAVSGCAGMAGDQEGNGGAGDGFEYGASQDEVDEVIADLDPVTLTNQSVASSPDSVQALGVIFEEAIEERSGGKIQIDTVYGQPIAGFTEVHDALADGRIDLAYTLPVYEPARFPNFDDLGYSLSLLPNSPMVGELATNAAALEIAWESDAVLEEFESIGVTPLSPVMASGSYYNGCTETGAAFDDWNGRQIRVASSSHQEMVNDLGATPVSLEFVEAYEALERNTIECALNQMSSKVDFGIIDAAPHLSYTTDVNIPRAPGAVLAGSSFENLPLAYQQIIFDSLIDVFQGSSNVVAQGNLQGVTAIKERGGEIQEFDDESQQSISETTANMIAEIEENGALGDDLAERMTEAGQKWADRAEELGFVDEGGLEDFDEWFDPDTDFRPFAEAVFEEVTLPHRPS